MFDIDKAYSVIQPGFRFNRHGIEKPLSPKQIQHKIKGVIKPNVTIYYICSQHQLTNLWYY